MQEGMARSFDQSSVAAFSERPPFPEYAPVEGEDLPYSILSVLYDFACRPTAAEIMVKFRI